MLTGAGEINASPTLYTYSTNVGYIYALSFCRIEEKIGTSSMRAIITMWHLYGFFITSAYSAVL
jgi:hypothetical protein